MLMIASRRSITRVAWLYVAVVAVTLGAAEAYFWHADSFRLTPSYSAKYIVRDDVLGAAPTIGVTGRSRLLNGNEVIYDVAYTIGSDRLRVSPPVHEPVVGSVVFFGCSYTFGEGLPDDATMPYRVGVISGGKYQIRNFGFHGYGAHQMLSALEAGVVERRAIRVRRAQQTATPFQAAGCAVAVAECAIALEVSQAGC